MKDSLTGRFSISGAGHDKGCVYLIVGEEDKHLYLTDGRFHPLDKPKKKSRKHVQITNKTAEEPFLSRLYNNDRIFDHEVKYAIKTTIRKEEDHVKE